MVYIDISQGAPAMLLKRPEKYQPLSMVAQGLEDLFIDNMPYHIGLAHCQR